MIIELTTRQLVKMLEEAYLQGVKHDAKRDQRGAAEDTAKVIIMNHLPDDDYKIQQS